MENLKINYTLIESEQCADGQSFITYGIAGATVAFADVSTNKTIVEEMINKINIEQLEESQLMYFIEDELNRSLI